MKGIMSIIEVMITGVILIAAFLHFFPQYSMRTEWDRVLLAERVRDTLNTLDRMNKTFALAADPRENPMDFNDFMETLFLPRLINVTMIWWKEVDNLTWGESMAIPYFTEGHSESMIDVDNVILHDNFNDGNDDGWIQEVGTWVVENWEYIGEPTDVGISRTDNQTTDNTIIDVNFNETGSGSSQNAFIIFDFISSSNFKFAGARVDQNEWVIGNYTSETWNYQNSYSETINPLKSYKMRVIIKDDTVNLYVNNTKKLDFDFSSIGLPIGSGTIGLGGENNNARFDDFAIRGNAYQVYSFTLGLGYPY